MGWCRWCACTTPRSNVHRVGVAFQRLLLFSVRTNIMTWRKLDTHLRYRSYHPLAFMSAVRLQDHWRFSWSSSGLASRYPVTRWILILIAHLCTSIITQEVLPRYHLLRSACSQEMPTCMCIVTITRHYTHWNIQNKRIVVSSLRNVSK